MEGVRGELLEAQRLLGAQEGIFAAPEGAAAPAPEATILTFAMSFFARRSALTTAAPTMTAVRSASGFAIPTR